MDRGSLLDFGNDEYLSRLERINDSRYMIQDFSELRLNKSLNAPWLGNDAKI